MRFTATSESADPEDVDQMLASYFAMARKEIEAYGGVVEKFIGDAVLSPFLYGQRGPVRISPDIRVGRP